MSHSSDSPVRPSRHKSNWPPRPKRTPLIVQLFWVTVIIAALLIGWWGVSFIR